MPHHIVALDGCYVEIPPFSLPEPHEYTEYPNTSPSEVSSRVHYATIVITNLAPLNGDTLRPEYTPRLQLIAVMAAGVDCVDIAACKARDIRVCNIPGGSATAASEHAIGMYFAVRRKVVELHNLTTKTTEWEEKGTLKGETMGIFGYGSIGRTALIPQGDSYMFHALTSTVYEGQKVASLARALGMRVLIASRNDGSDRNGLIASASSGHSSKHVEAVDKVFRTPFDEVLAQSTVLVIAIPRLPSTIDMISDPEFSMMQINAILINVARGGIVNEHALAHALKRQLIAGAATDVFATEPAGKATSPLLAESLPNLTVSPHLAWYAQSTQDTRARQIKEIVEGFVTGGDLKNVVV